ncbi:sulfotransferase 1B1-like [Argiope bruennichi]|uniref:Sulfotransferase family cytosolic 1B member 1 like protein n=1 Tax=Argiope bruennichi TaxID=94029 RepID=A0A8T0FAP9_ARGBR|nr:sulfotransferase 1B1-like [Argiope bruennichi]KAF8787315.1 Sulfotransferase family cytosolic 1B member 1 like protein [Argiope bruennichi]
MAPTQIIRGLPFPKASWFSEKNIEDTLDYVPHDGDIIIASYPKTGTTWLQYVVFQILSQGELFPNIDDCIYKYAPYLEMSGTAVLENMEKPRVYKHHCPYNMVQKNDKAKYIYIYRKPEDTIISYYHFALSLGFETPELDEFFEDFISGNIGYGHYFDHVLSFFDHKDDENVLLVSYEKLLLNKREEILRIAKYFGDEYYQTLSENESIMDKVLEHTSFDYMKKNLSLTHPGEEGAKRKVNFFRKGTIGDGKQSLKPEQLKRLKDLAKKKLEGSDLLKEWFDE